MSNKNVVLCVDGSDYAKYAFDWYCEHLHKEGQTLAMLHVPEGFVNISMMSPARHLECKREAEEKAKEIEKMYIQKATERGIPHTFYKIEISHETEKTGAAIVRECEKLEPIFLVTGTRGQGAIKRTILGSVSDYLVHHCHCPVLVARHKDEKHHEQQHH